MVQDVLPRFDKVVDYVLEDRSFVFLHAHKPRVGYTAVDSQQHPGHTSFESGDGGASRDTHF